VKAIQYRTYGGYHENRLVDLERTRLKEGEVLVEMRTVGINPLDNTFRSGHIYLATPENLPRVGLAARDCQSIPTIGCARSGSLPDRGSPIRSRIDAGIALWKSYRTLIEPSYPYHRLIVWHPPSWGNQLGAYVFSNPRQLVRRGRYCCTIRTALPAPGRSNGINMRKDPAATKKAAACAAAFFVSGVISLGHSAEFLLAYRAFDFAY
jgi:hypothetical protein